MTQSQTVSITAVFKDVRFKLKDIDYDEATPSDVLRSFKKTAHQLFEDFDANNICDDNIRATLEYEDSLDGHVNCSLKTFAGVKGFVKGVLQEEQENKSLVLNFEQAIGVTVSVSRGRECCDEKANDISSNNGASKQNTEEKHGIFIFPSQSLNDLYDKIEQVGKIKDIDGELQLFSVYNKSQNNKRIMRSSCTKIIDGGIKKFDELECKFDYGRLNMMIFAKTLTGKMIVLMVNDYCTIGDVKYLIHRREKIEPKQQKIISKGKVLQDLSTIQQCQIGHESIVHMVLNLKGS